MDTIKSGQWVVLQREDYVKVSQVTEKSHMSLGRDILDLSSLVGRPEWGSYFMEEAAGKNKKDRKHVLKACDATEFEESLVDSLVDDGTGKKDNRFIKDDGQSQRLSKEAIEGLQADGATAKEIVGHLVENSATFDQKTAFAQEKYVSKKQKKYKKCVLVRPTTFRLVQQALTAPAFQDPNPKLLGLRVDSLSQIASLSGVQAGCGPSTFFLFDSGSQGLVTSALIERLSADSDSRLVVLSPARGTSKVTAIQAMNYTPELLQKVHYFGIADFLKRASSCGLISKKVSTDADQESETNNKRPAETPSEGPESKRPNSNLETELAEVMERLRVEKAASLVIVGKENPSEVCDLLLPLVGLSRPVVMYSQFREPLQDVYMKLKADKSVTALKLTEPWLRKYQIMPDRTHPEVLMSGSGGYVLSGVTVECD